MYTTTLSSNSVKLLSKVLHSTSKSIGRTSKLASQREILSKLLGFNDWNVACAILPEHLLDTTHVSIALLELPSAASKFFIATGNDAPWRLPEKVRDHLVNQSLNPEDLIVSSHSKPDPTGDVRPRYWYCDFISKAEPIKTFKIELSSLSPDYSYQNLSPAVMTFTDKKGHEVCTVTVWHVTLFPAPLKAMSFIGAASMPLYNTFIESITGRMPELREAYCLVSSRQDGYDSAVVKCNERGAELEVMEHLRYMDMDLAWAKLASYNKKLGLSLLDVADITSACFSEDDA